MKVEIKFDECFNTIDLIHHYTISFIFNFSAARLSELSPVWIVRTLLNWSPYVKFVQQAVQALVF